MSWFTNIFSSGASKLVESVGTAIDSLVTSDEERLQLKNELEAQINRFKEVQLQAQAQHDKELTARLKLDNENLITRLVRPISFLFILFLFALIVLFDGNIFDFKVNAEYIPVIQSLLLTMIGFYFGGRSFEKVTKAKNKND